MWVSVCPVSVCPPSGLTRVWLANPNNFQLSARCLTAEQQQGCCDRQWVSGNGGWLMVGIWLINVNANMGVIVLISGTNGPYH